MREGCYTGKFKGYSGSDNLVGRPQFWFEQWSVWVEHKSPSHRFLGPRSGFSRIHPLSGSQGRCSGHCHIHVGARVIFNNSIDHEDEDYEK